jgi:serine/threonine protein kinase
MRRFRKIRSLGRGQSGEVWLVEREDASLVAMKQVYIEDENSVNQEVSALESLEHVNIIQYHESFVQEGYLYIVIDYAEGGDLASRIRAAKSKPYSFPEAQIRKWFIQMCMALDYIHSKKILHRDLKTQNIFLTKSGDVKIGDFGICRVFSKSDELASTSVGTPYYIAPEVCRGELYSYKADIWSLGCILYELCTLQRPFKGESIATVLTSILNQDPEPFPCLYSESLTSSVFSMLSKNPASRPSASDLIEKMTGLPSTERKEVNGRYKKTYQKEISIKIPTPTNAPAKNPSSAPNNIIASPGEPLVSATNQGTYTKRNTIFNFSESLLKQCPNSPIRPMLMGDFLKRRLGEEVFTRIKNVINNSKDPASLLREEPWIFSDICGEENLSTIDAAIACGAFNFANKPIFPVTGSHKMGKERGFPILSRKASQ